MMDEVTFGSLPYGAIMMAVAFMGGMLNLRHEKIADDLALVDEKFWTGAEGNGELVHMRPDTIVWVRKVR
jgi:hypothetical protein